MPAAHRLARAHAAAAALRRSPGVQRVSYRGRPADRDARLDRSRPARRAQPLARRRARRARSATTTSPRSARPRATWCRSTCSRTPTCARREEFENLIVADRDGAIVRLARRRARRARRRRSRHGRQVQRPARPCTSASGRCPARTRSKWRTGCATRWSASGRRCPRTSTCGSRTTRTMFMEDALDGDHQDADRDDPDRRPWSCSCSWARCAPRSCRWWRCRSRWSARRIVMLRVRLQPEPADDPRDRAVGRPGGRRRDRGRRERRAARARWANRASRRRWSARASCVGPIIAMTITLAAVYAPIALPGRADRLAVPRVRDHAGRRGRGVRHRRGHAVAGDELALRARRTARKAG